MLTHGTADNTAVRLNKMNYQTEKQGPPCKRRPIGLLVLLFTSLFAAALSRQRFLHALFLARLEVEGVTFHLLDDVLLLDFALEAPEGIF